ncbi:ABC transporter ATP-binding protein [Ilumatobacter sp.]|uniref:ABC transporter ATP-binding protein n=1 Tax=Ilumatobacter sp. TaxID=1967498 RepID=UPI003C6A1A4A
MTTDSGATGSRWRALGALLRPDASRWVGLGTLVALSSALTITGPLVIRRIIDDATDGATSGEITRLALVFLAIAAVTQVLAVIVAWLATVAAWRTTNGLRLRMTRHVLGLDHEFHRTHTPGELIQRVDGDITSVSDFLSQVVTKAAGAAMLVAGIVVVLTVLDWRLGLGMAVYLALAFAVVIRTRHRAVSESSDEMGALGRLYGGIEERLTAGEDLRANGAADHVAWRLIEDSEDALTSAVRRERAFLVMWWFVQGAVAGGWVIALVLGSLLVSANTISIGTAFLLFQYVLLVARPLEEVVHELETVQKANGAMVRVLDLLAIEPRVLDEGTVRPPPGPLSITSRHVSFDYGDDRPVLCDVDLRIEAGRSVGIVGRTGSGKTSFSRVVLRLVEPSEGMLDLGDVPIADIPLDELRRRVALVPQEVELFAGTVRDNVTLFDAAPLDADVAAALRRVGLDALADAGIDRMLGAAGSGLSAGEAQLLALARVWLRDPDILVLDEATARVDPETEQRLERAVSELVQGRTTLVIAHRLSTLRTVDEIIVFDHGAVVEHGNRSDLVGDDDSRFAALLALALDREQLDGSVITPAAPTGGYAGQEGSS